MSGFLVVITVVLILVIIFQIAKASEYVSVLKGEKKAQEQSNRINATLMIVFLILGLIGIYVCNELLKDKMLPEAASIQGKSLDKMMFTTLVITGIVLIITEVLLFYFAYRYRDKPGRKALFFPEHDKLEYAWTAIPAVVMLILVVFGLKEWFKITGEAPKDAMVVEVTGKQFQWMFRYGGIDDQLGKKDYKLVDAGKNNPLGQDWSDKKNQDDVVSSGVMHLVVNRPVRLIINSQDVIHDVGLPHFRLKMDAVPGIPTTLWFTPTITTEEMKKKTGDKNFVYELACDQLCGNGHYSMRGTIIVETAEEFKKWETSQKSQYQLATATEQPAAKDSSGVPSAMPAADSTKSVALR